MFNHPAREDPVRTLRVSRGLLLWVEELRWYNRKIAGGYNPHIENNVITLAAKTSPGKQT